MRVLRTCQNAFIVSVHLALLVFLIEKLRRHLLMDFFAKDGIERYVAMQHNHGRLGNQLFYFCIGYVIAKQLNRSLYVPYNASDKMDYNVLRRMLWTTTIFPLLRPLYKPLQAHLINQTVVPFAYNQSNQPSCCLYENPMKFANHSAKYLLLDIKFAQNARFFDGYTTEILKLLQFAPSIREQGRLAIQRLKLDYSPVLCVHTRREDFVTLNLSIDPSTVIRVTRQLAKATGFYHFLIFGDDRIFMQMIANNLKFDENGTRCFVADISTFTEGVDLYISSQVCNAFFISATISTFGWWLAFFARNQNRIYYLGDERPMRDKIPNKDLFLKSWKLVV